MYRIIIFIAIMSIFSCRFLNTSEITEKEFKEKFMSAKSVAKIIDMSNNSWFLEFYNSDKKKSIKLGVEGMLILGVKIQVEFGFKPRNN